MADMYSFGLTVAFVLVFSPFTLSLLNGLGSLSVRRSEVDTQDDPNPTPKPVPEQWFYQKLDHFNPADNRYWQQRYYINDTFYKPGGPAFLYIGGEGELPEISARLGAWLEYAQKYNAICFAIEHRYYGKSRPLPDLSTANMHYLTVEQALGDLATFITVKNKQPNMTSTKWIVFGGSYTGMLSAYMRYKFPHLVAGAAAHSATIALPVADTAYTAAMGDALHTEPGCFEAVKVAFDDIRNKLKTDAGTETLRDLLGLCVFDRNNNLDVENVMSEVMSTLMQVIQYSGDIVDYFPTPIPTVADMCGVLTDNTRGQPLARLAYYIASLTPNNTSQNTTCHPAAFDTMIQNGKVIDYDDILTTDRRCHRRLCQAPISLSFVDLDRSWKYQMCTQIGNFVISNTGSQPFGKTATEDYYLKTCEVYFGSKFDKALVYRGHDELMMNYGGRNMKATHIVYTQGSFDPYRTSGFTTDDIPGSHVIVIQGVGHTAPMAASSPRDSAEMKHARARISRYIGQWISSRNDVLIG